MFRRSTSIHFITAVVGIILGGMIAHPSAQGFSLFYWAEQDRFSPGEPGHHFGESVAIDGDIMVVGATYSSQYAVPAAYVYTRVGDTWTDAETLIASDDTWAFGYSVAIDGNTVVVGASSALVDGNEQGAAYVFTDVGAAWTVKTETAKLTASDGAAYDAFGRSVAIDGNTVVVGADGIEAAGHSDPGAAYVFMEAGGVWTETAILTASNGAAADSFGSSVAIDGDTVVVGRTGGEGAAYVFARAGSTWMETTQLLAPQASSWFGSSVAIDGDRVVVGAPGFGAVYIFTRSGTTWVQDGFGASDGYSAGSDFGRSVAVEGVRIVVGAPGADNDDGAAYVYTLTGTSWKGRKLPPPPHFGVADFGRSVALAGNTLVVGAPGASYHPDWDTGGGAHVFVRKSIFVPANYPIRVDSPPSSKPQRGGH